MSATGLSRREQQARTRELLVYGSMVAIFVRGLQGMVEDRAATG